MKREKAIEIPFGAKDSELIKWGYTIPEGMEVKYIDADKIRNALQQEQGLIVINKKDWKAQEQFRKNKDFGKPLQQEQPEVDLEKEIDNYFDTIQAWQIQEAPFTTMDKCARHFYELGIKARKEK